jgi:hypothetical protein
VLVILLATISGCELYEGPYTFRQDQRNIEKIEVCSYDSYNKITTPIVQLSDYEEEQLLLKLSSMECYEFFGDHPREYGQAVICIHYLDREIEIIGITNIGWITPDGKRAMSSYSFDWVEMQELILSLVDEDDLPELRSDPWG